MIVTSIECGKAIISVFEYWCKGVVKPHNCWLVRGRWMLLSWIRNEKKYALRRRHTWLDINLSVFVNSAENFNFCGTNVEEATVFKYSLQAWARCVSGTPKSRVRPQLMKMLSSALLCWTVSVWCASVSHWLYLGWILTNWQQSDDIDSIILELFKLYLPNWLHCSELRT